MKVRFIKSNLVRDYDKAEAQAWIDLGAAVEVPSEHKPVREVKFGVGASLAGEPVLTATETISGEVNANGDALPPRVTERFVMWNVSREVLEGRKVIFRNRTLPHGTADEFRAAHLRHFGYGIERAWEVQERQEREAAEMAAMYRSKREGEAQAILDRLQMKESSGPPPGFTSVPPKPPVTFVQELDAALAAARGKKGE